MSLVDIYNPLHMSSSHPLMDSVSALLKLADEPCLNDVGDDVATRRPSVVGVWAELQACMVWGTPRRTAWRDQVVKCLSPSSGPSNCPVFKALAGLAAGPLQGPMPPGGMLLSQHAPSPSPLIQQVHVSLSTYTCHYPYVDIQFSQTPYNNMIQQAESAYT